MSILDFALSVEDFRQPWKVRHLSTDIIFITVAAVICGAKDWEDVFIFVSRNRTNIKLLRWDTDGFILYHKRLERGTFEMPIYDTTSNTHTLSWSTFSLIMQGVNLKSVKYRKRFRIE